MSIIFFDTETTGLAPGQICQLAYVKLFAGGEISGANYYFRVEHMPEAATEIHGLTAELLLELSGGKTFADFAGEISAEFSAADMLVAHNFPFDRDFLSAELARAGKFFRYNGSFCTMRKLTPVMKLFRSDGRTYKYPRLEEVGDFFGIKEEAEMLAKTLFADSAGFHDARYDAALVYSAFMRLAAVNAEANGILELLNRTA